MNYPAFYFFMEYIQKLKDPRWQRKRLTIMDRDQWTCRRCDCTERTLQIHHLYYKPQTEPWDYPDEALITLCDLCHEKAEFMKWVVRYGIRNLAVEGFTNFDLSEIYEFIKGKMYSNDHPESCRRFMNDLRNLMSSDIKPSYSFF